MRLRFWLATMAPGFLAACLLAACASPGGSGATKTDAGPSGNQQKAAEPEGFRYFGPEFEGLVMEMGGKLLATCGGFGRSGGALDRCMREHVSSAFDDSGEGRTKCAYHEELTDFIGCVAIGNTFIDMRHRLADDSPVPGGFWTDGGAMTDALVETIVQRGIAACGVGESADATERCVDRWFEQSLALPAGMVQRCPGTDSATGHTKERQGCLAEATMVRFMRDHLPRLDAIST